MNIKRPIVFIDIEATGADATRDRIVEIALIRVHPDRTTAELVQRINPGVRIPWEVTSLHGIANEHVAQSPSFREFAPTLIEFIQGCDIGGFGITRFDIPILVEEFRRCNQEFLTHDRSLIDALTIYHQKERRDLTAAYQFYCQKPLIGAHGARADAQASMEVIFAQLEHYPELPRETVDLHLFCNKQDERFVDSAKKFAWRDGEAAFNFGKYKGELLKNMVRNQRDYIEWMVSDGKFAQDVIDICWKALKGEFPVNPKAPKRNGSGHLA